MSLRTYIQPIILAIGISFMLGGCGKKEAVPLLDPDAPTVVTLWHAYNAVAKTELDSLLLEFNETIGTEEGILIDARGFGSSEDLEEALYTSANHVIGSDPLPNLFTSYPDNAYRLDQIVPLVNFDDYFTEQDFAKYRAEFLEEGVWDASGSHKMIPVAKSTELLYLNRTDWDKFSEETGASEELLKTWEGLGKAAKMYYDWSGGNAFLGINSYNDFAVLTAAQLGEAAFSTDGNGVFTYSRETAEKAWEVYYIPHIKGWFKSSVYNQDGIKSGRLMAYIGSSAGAGFFPAEVIKDDNTSYPVECEILPYPTFQNGTIYMTQRGADMAAFSSDKQHEYAAARFLSWFTAPEQNIRFAVSTGYLPVEKKALESVSRLTEEITDKTSNTKAIEASLKASLDAMNKHIFYVRKPFPDSYSKIVAFSSSLENQTVDDLKEMARREKSGETKEELEADYTGNDHFNCWYEALMKEMAGKHDE